MLIGKGTFVEIESVVLTPDLRAPQVPEDTRKTPLKMWVKGRLQADCALNAKAEILTATGRIVSGELVAVEPRYTHDFGDYVESVTLMRESIKKAFFEGVL